MYVTKPAGCFLQLVGAVFFFAAIGTFVVDWVRGLVFLGIAIGCLWWGRQTKRK